MQGETATTGIIEEAGRNLYFARAEGIAIALLRNGGGLAKIASSKFRGRTLEPGQKSLAGNLRPWGGQGRRPG